MSTTVDQRVVEMRFDNSHFEKNVQTSINTTNNLKESLNFDSVSKGFENINKGASKVNLTGLSSAIENVGVKLSAMQVMATTALANITNSAVNAGKKIAKALTIDPIKTGFSEYETQINATQTILANTQARQKNVSKDAMAEIESTAGSSLEEIKSINEQSVEELRRSNDKKLREAKKLADDEMDILENKHDDELSDLKKTLADEKRLIEKASDDKNAIYHEEYMRKLKANDEERYNKLKAIDDEIKGIKGLTAAEEKARKQQEQNDNIAQMQDAIASAQSEEEAMFAVQALSSYRAALNQQQVLEERENQIATLEAQKDGIDDEYDEKERKLKEEYEVIKAQENETLKLRLESLKTEQDEQLKALDKKHEFEKEQLDDIQEEELYNIKELQNAEIASLKSTNKVALANIESEKQAKLAAMSEVDAEMTEGTTITQVNAALDKLNEYADRTIYNFTEMTKNIGTFTAAGVGLDESVSSIKGIANIAALSGSTSQQASNAMYQLSQAIAAGKVSLMDWNSVVNAGMGGQVFQDALKRTAKAMGIAVDESVSFRESIGGGDSWLSADVLTKTLSQFTGDLTDAQLEQQGFNSDQIKQIQEQAQLANDAATEVKTFTQLVDTMKESVQSGWSQSWRTIIGDFEEAKDFYSEASENINVIISNYNDARNSILTDGLSSGWKQFLDKGIAQEDDYIARVKNIALKQGIITKEAQAEIKSFADLKDKGLLTADLLSAGVSELYADYKNLSDEELKQAGYTREQINELETLNSEIQNGSINMSDFVDKMGKNSGRDNIIEAIFNSFKALGNIIKPISDAFGEIFEPFTGADLYSITGWLKDFTAGLKISDETADKLKRTFKGVFAVFDIVKEVIGAVVKAIGSLFGGSKPLLDVVLNITAAFGDWLVGLRDFIVESEVITSVMQGIADVISFVVAALTDNFVIPGFELFHSLLERIHARMSQVGEATSGMKSVFVIAVETMGKALQESTIYKTLTTLWNGIRTVVSSVVSILSGLIKKLSLNMSEINFDNVFDVINSVSLSAIALGIVGFVKSFKKSMDSFGGMLDGIVGILDSVKGCLEAWQMSLKADALLKIAAAVGILAVSILLISVIDSKKLAESLAAITVLFADLMGSMAIFSHISGATKGVFKSCLAMISISVAVLILASALKKISTIDIEELGIGLAGVAGLMAMIVIVSRIMDKNEKTIFKGAINLIAFSVALKILASVCTDLSKLSWKELGVGISGVAGLMALVVIVAKLMSKNKNAIIKGAANLILFSVAIKILASVCIDLSKLSWDELIKGLLAMAVSLTLVVAALKLMPKNMIGIGVGLLAVTTSLVIMSKALSNMGGMSDDEIIRSLAALGGSLLTLAVGLRLMNGTLAGTAALLLAVSALAVLTPILSILGAMSWEAIIKGLVAVAGAITIIGVAGLLLTPIIPSILALAGSFALMGIGILALGAGLVTVGLGLSAIAIGFAALATALTAGATAINAALTVMIIGAVELIPLILIKVGEGIISLLKTIADSATALGEVFKTFVLVILDVLVECIPAIVEGIFKLLDRVLIHLRDYIPKMVETLFQFIIAILDKLIEYTPTFIDRMYQFIITIIDGIARNIPDLIQSCVNLLMSFFFGIVDALKTMDIDAMLNGIAGIGLLAVIMLELAAIAVLTPGAMAGVLGLGALITELAIVIAALGALSQIPGLEWLVSEGGDFLEVVGVAIGKFLGGIAGGIASGITSQFPQIGTDLSDFMTNVTPFVEGAKKIDPAMMDGVKSIVDVMLLLTAANILESLTSWLTGGSSLTSFAEELVPFGTALKSFSNEISGLDGDLVEKAATAGKTIAEMAATLPNSGGVVGWFMGENDMGTFGIQLPLFGAGIKAFADSVVGIDAASVENAATAGLAIAELASALPNSGGVVGWFTGDNDIDIFGEQLPIFGKGIKAFADSVVGIDGAAVDAAANSGLAIAELAHALPNTGGAVSWFTGDNDMDTFGTQLELFGVSMAAYATSIADVKPDTVNATTDAASSLVALADGLPDKSNWFSSTMSLEDFGDDMKKFGEAFVKYYNAIKEVNVDDITDVNNAIVSVTTLLAGMKDVKAGTGQNFKDTVDDIVDTDFENLIGIFDEDTTSAKVKTVMATVVEMSNSLANISLLDATAGASFKAVIGDISDSKLDTFVENFKDVNTNTLTAVTTLITDTATSLSTMADVTVASAENLATAIDELGKSEIATFVETFQDVDGVTVSSITTRIGYLATSLSTMADVDPKVAENFKDALADLADSRINGFVKTAGEAGVDNLSTLLTSVTDIATELSTMKNIDTTNAQDFKTAMADLADSKVDEFTAAFGTTYNLGSAKTTVSGLATTLSELKKVDTDVVVSLTTAIKDLGNAKIKDFIETFRAEDRVTELVSAGGDVVTHLVDGMVAKGESLKTASEDIMFSVIVILTNYATKFDATGQLIASSFIQGICVILPLTNEAFSITIGGVLQNVLDMGQHFFDTGKYLMSCLIDGLAIDSDGISKATNDSFSTVISSVQSLVDSDMDIQPTIRPVLDLTGVTNGINDMNGMMSGSRSYGLAMDTQYSWEQPKGYSQNEVNASTGNNYYYSFEQTNNSPEALSDWDIYRNTQNMLTTMGGVR